MDSSLVGFDFGFGEGEGSDVEDCVDERIALHLAVAFFSSFQSIVVHKA